MVIEKKRSIFFKVLSVFLVALMCFSMAAPALAATSKTIKSNSGTTVVRITTGSGWQYSCGFKKTTVTVRNTGNRTVTLYKNIGQVGYSWEGSLAPGQTRTYTAKGSGKTYYLKVQGTGTVRVSVSAGSVR